MFPIQKPTIVSKETRSTQKRRASSRVSLQMTTHYKSRVAHLLSGRKSIQSSLIESSLLSCIQPPAQPLDTSDDNTSSVIDTTASLMMPHPTLTTKPIARKTKNLYDAQLDTAYLVGEDEEISVQQVIFLRCVC